MKTKHSKPYWEMNASELAAATAEFDQSMIMDSFHPLSKDDRATWAKVKRKRGRPRVGKGAKVISVSIEGGLLQRIDKAARRLKTSRAGFMATCARRVLAEVEPSRPRKRSGKRAA
jgi:hypothetical protein